MNNVDWIGHYYRMDEGAQYLVRGNEHLKIPDECVEAFHHELARLEDLPRQSVHGGRIYNCEEAVQIYLELCKKII